ncbi:putative tail assembly chaperone [Pantoea phage Nafs113]|nr:putative tail assembly chaperone [Pantoea phage Nafs113]
MSVNIKTFSVGDRQFQMFTLQPFAAVQHSLKLKKILERGLGKGLDSNVVSVLENIDEKTLTEVIFPILRDTALTCTSAEQKLQSPNDMNEVFSIEDMDEFFIVVWEVLKANFGPFFQKMAKNLFGFDLAEIDLDKLRSQIKQTLDKAKADKETASLPKTPAA